jgi:mono/diheme cytochrome c family protein
MADGGGIAEVFPRFNGSAAIQAKNPDSVIHVVLDGAQVPATSSKPAAFAMPAFGWKFTDQEVADIVNYIRNTWGNRAPPTTAGAVADVREAARHSGGK